MWYLQENGLPRQFTYDSAFLAMLMTVIVVLAVRSVRKRGDPRAFQLLQVFAVIWFCVAWAHVGFIAIAHRLSSASLAVESLDEKRPRASDLLTPEGAASLVHAGQAGSGSLATYAEALRQAGDGKQSLEQFQSAIAIDETYIDAQVGVIRCLASLGELDRAQTHLDGLLSRHQDESVRAYLYYWSAVLADANRDAPGAVHALKTAVQLQPQVQHYWTELGMALLAVNALDEAAKAFEASVAIDQRGVDAAIAYVGLAEISYRRRRSDSEIYSLLLRSIHATWVKPPKDLLPYLEKRGMRLEPDGREVNHAVNATWAVGRR